MKNFLILLLMISVSAFGVIKHEIPNNDFKMGDGISTDKVMEFDAGLGASNPKITSTSTSFNFNKSAALIGNMTLNGTGNFTTNGKIITKGATFSLGGGVDSDKYHYFDIGLGSNNPRFRYDSTGNKLLFSNGSGAPENEFGAGDDGFVWQVVTENTTMQPNNGYIANVSDTATPLKFFLPTTLATGDLFSIAGLGNDGWELYSNLGTATQSLTYQENSTATSSFSTIKLAYSNNSWGSSDFLVTESNHVILPRNDNETLFAAGVPYFSGISAHWKMDETTGNIVDSFASNDLARTGVPVHQASGIFDDKGSYSFPSGASLRVFNAAFINTQGVNTDCTFECWIKFGTFNSDSRFIFINTRAAYDSAASAIFMYLEANDNTLFWGATNPSTVEIDGYIDSEWHHLAGVINSADPTSKKRIYIDGVSVGTVENTGDTYSDADGYLAIGGTTSANQSLINGNIDEAVYWHGTAMTAAQVLERYNAGKGARYYQP